MDIRQVIKKLLNEEMGKVTTSDAAEAEKLAKKGLDVELTTEERLAEILRKNSKIGDYIKDFYKSDAPQFKGKSKDERRKMAIAAYLNEKKGKDLDGDGDIDSDDYLKARDIAIKKAIKKEDIINEEKISEDKIERVIKAVLKKEGGAAGLDPIKKAVKKLNVDKDFNLEKFIKKLNSVTKHRHGDYILK